MRDLSVIMPTYNEDFDPLRTCIDSVLQQSHKNFEFVIVVEPDEKNIDFLEGLADIDGRVRVIKNETKIGVSGSRNIAISNSTGKYISLVDGDDFFGLDRFEKQLEFLESNPGISAVGSNMYLIDENNNIVGERKYPETFGAIKKYFLLTMSIANPAIMMRRKDIEEVGFFNSRLTKAEDFELWLRFMAMDKKMHNLQESMVYYRVPARQNAKRGKIHWENNYTARKKYGKFIWPLHQRSLSLSIYYIASHVPDVLLDRIFNMSLLHKIRNIKINQ